MTNINMHRLRLVLGNASFAFLVACGGADNEPASREAAMPPLAAKAMVAETTRGDLTPQSGGFGIALSAAPIANLGENYQTLVGVNGGTAPYKFEVIAGTMPAGLVLDNTTGRLQGRPSTMGRFELTIKVTDARGASTIGAFTLTVIEADAPVAANADRTISRAAGRTLGISKTDGLVGTAPTTSPIAPASLANLMGLLTPIPEGSWVMANLNQFLDVWTPESQRVIEKNSGGVASPRALIAAWSSFAWDSNRGDLILYGGGHANYGGNEVYRWRGSTRMWERASLPSQISQDALGNYRAIDGPDNAPVSAHTYDNNIFLPTLDRFMTFGGAAYNNGDAYLRDNGAGASRYTGPYLWDPSKADPNKVGGTTGSHVQRVAPYPEVVGGQMWQNRDIKLNLSGTPNLPSAHVVGCTGYALEGGKDVVYVGAHIGNGVANHLFRYVINDVNSPSTDSWTKIGGYYDGPQSQTACAFDPVQKLFVHVGDKTRPFLYWNVNTPSASGNIEVKLTFTEASGELMSRLNAGSLEIRNCGFEFDPVRRHYSLWCGGADIWTLTPPATVSSMGWVLLKQTIPGGSTPTTAVGTGILGKWKYIPNIDAFMGLQDSNAGNIWIYKPFGWQPPNGGPVNVPPSVALTAPTGGQTFVQNSPIGIQATANDSDGSVTKVEFFDGATKIGTAVQAPWQMSWSGASVGTHQLTARATDNLGGTTTSAAVSISVGAANVAPSATITSPTAGQTFGVGTPVPIIVNAVDSDGQVVKVDFFDGATLIGSIAQSPWQFSWSGASAGSHALKAVATDNRGASTTSAIVTISISAINQAPTITLTSPTAGQIFTQSQAITLVANPIDPEGRVNSVHFLDGTTALATLNAPPWQFVIPNAALGSHTYSARVTDEAGNTGTSAGVTVQVNPDNTGATTVVLQDGLNGYSGTRDTYLYSFWSTYNLGALTTMVEQGGYSFPLVRFAIFNREGGPVPDNATVTSAKLALYKTTYYNATFSASRLLCDWRETEITWNLCRNGTNWVSGGAAGVGTDYLSVADGVGSVGWDPGVWLEIDVKNGLTAMQTAAAPNYGWRIVRTAGDNVNQKRFNTRNFMTNPSLRPKLTISYTTN